MGRQVGLLVGYDPSSSITTVLVVDQVMYVHADNLLPYPDMHPGTARRYHKDHRWDIEHG
jgi:hypothetical protein